MSSNALGARRHRRYAVDVAATTTIEGRRLEIRTRDLSRNGICLITKEAMVPGSVANLELVLAFGNDSFSEPLVLAARVVWCTQLGGSFQIGAMFEELTDQQDGFLEMFLQFLDGTLRPRDVDGVDYDGDSAEPDDDETFGG